ncbi:MAG: radical SAM family heme chaperone HemW [Flavobacteriaceae bacterium]|nr:radical SAM family heme chaperone HemW [Flavobacteriaceae bacterium]
MAGIYIHIPFCKQACYYCDFHFSTSLSRKEEMVQALASELQLRSAEFKNVTVQTIYFGGGTPSLLAIEEVELLIDVINKNYKVIQNPEITLEANPDDLSKKQIQKLAKTPLNRLSIGIQSFFDSDLRLMNRAHSAKEAGESLQVATKYFDNISIDLIYGIPDASDEQWMSNIETALSFDVPHISSYALTVEPKTALENFIKKGIVKDVDDEQAQRQFTLMVERLTHDGFVHYELSNFGKERFFSRNNSAYWQGKPYLGIGPSAHSFDGEKRSWNIRNNIKYIKSIANKEVPSTSEILTKTDQFNEAIMTGLRTMWGVSLEKIEAVFGSNYKKYLLQQAEIYIKQDLLYIDDNKLLTTQKGKFLSDGISSDLFKLNL